MLNLGWIRLGGTLGKIFLLICSIIIGLGFFYCTPFSLLGFGSGNSMHVPKSFRFILWQCVIYYHWNLLMCNVGCIFDEFEWGTAFPMGLLIWHFGQCFCNFFSSNYSREWFWFTNMFFCFSYIFFVKMIFEVILNCLMYFLWISNNLASTILYGWIFRRFLM